MLQMILIILIALFLVAGVTGATTTLRVAKVSRNGSTVFFERTLSIADMAQMTVLGDGKTHYYLQGPTHDEENVWDEDETAYFVDMGAVKGTNLKDLCELVGGLAIDEVVEIRNLSGNNRTFDWFAVYEPSEYQGPIGICWNKDGMDSGKGYTDGMRNIFFADNSTNEFGYNVYGNYDMTELTEEFQYLEDGIWPSSSGLSIPDVSEIIIHSVSNAQESGPDSVVPTSVPTLPSSAPPTKVSIPSVPGTSYATTLAMPTASPTYQTTTVLFSYVPPEETFTDRVWAVVWKVLILFE